MYFLIFLSILHSANSIKLPQQNCTDLVDKINTLEQLLEENSQKIKNLEASGNWHFVKLLAIQLFAGFSILLATIVATHYTSRWYKIWELNYEREFQKKIQNSVRSREFFEMMEANFPESRVNIS